METDPRVPQEARVCLVLLAEQLRLVNVQVLRPTAGSGPALVRPRSVGA